MGRLFRFGLTGLASTGVSYLVFVGLMRGGLHYVPASAAAWAGGILVGFALNRRFTFGIRGAAYRTRDFALYLTGAAFQLLAGMAGYAVLIGMLRLGPTPAFLLNLPFTTTVNFLFLRFVTFRRATAS